jgi:drug/metabolite transporter superfamily protein YnfA
MPELKTLALFFLTALAEIAGCYLPWLWLREGKSAWLLLPGALCLAVSPGCSLCTPRRRGGSTRPTVGSTFARR